MKSAGAVLGLVMILLSAVSLVGLFTVFLPSNFYHEQCFVFPDEWNIIGASTSKSILIEQDGMYRILDLAGSPYAVDCGE